MSRSRAALRAFTPVALLMSLTACAGSPGTGQDTAAPDAAPAPGFPYTVTNCGVSSTYQAPPRRAVTMNQHATEVMLALGLGDRVVGTAYLDDAVLPAYKPAYDKIKVLAEEYPSKEILLGADPDFVYGGYASAFDKAQGRDRAGLAQAGINSRLNVEYCTEGKVGLDQLKTEITEVARTFGVPDRGAKLIEDEQRRIDSVAARVKDRPRPTVFAYDSGEATASTSGGNGVGNEIISLAGGTNVFADLDDTFGDVAWEKVIERRPEVVLIYDYGGTTVEAKKQRLLNDPALAEVPAVKNRRFVVLPLSSAVLGVRVADAVEALGGQLHPNPA
ncbi:MULTISPECIES: ABC transporter substrate-binding protein [Streptomyces]|uniref:ABC transporter substrate-binding protein n=1 Tax=Streptomyces yangpuensis TaxID=1648182 RepID=A0ABY5Q589_9ACTN|nr:MULTISPECIES: ABC transporter substrate-binding protein [Streptomyces]MBZ9599921.1 ABC transporter substrate-binding protein [Streptomyces erythrochromogenes]UUY51479.1 ABC transporter substrate-binding protein [Streptomyces yangpuensis]